MKTKIKAFTLSEMLVVLLLTAIVVGIAFSILSLVQRQMGGIQNTLEDGSRFRQLKQQAAIDINTFQEFKFIKKDSALVFSHPMDSIVYKFENKTIIRHADTFKVNLNSFKLYYNGIETSEGKIDAFKLNTLQNGYQRQIFLYKLQDSETLMH